MSAQRNLPAYRGPHITYAVLRPFRGMRQAAPPIGSTQYIILFIIWILYNPLIYTILYNSKPSTFSRILIKFKFEKYFMSEWVV